MPKSIRRNAGLFIAAIVWMLTISSAMAQLNIIPTFDSSITGQANGAAIENEIAYASRTIGALFANNTTVNILFKFGNISGLGQSSTGFYSLSYAGYTRLLKGDASANPGNAVLSAAVNNFAYGNDAAGQRPIVATSAQLRALGASWAAPCYGANGAFGCGQTFDGVVVLSSTAPFNFTTGALPNYNGSNNQYSALGTTEHEIGEILGIGGSGSTLNAIYSANLNNVPDPYFTNAIGALDLYRYSGYHSPSFTTSSSATPYFSIDGGGTPIISFNQNSSGDFGDWGLNSCSSGFENAQQAFACRNATPYPLTLASPEAIALEALGYDPLLPASSASGPSAAASGIVTPVVAVPEMPTWTMLLIGFLGVGVFRGLGVRAAITN